MSNQNDPIITRNFIKNLSRGLVKSLPIGSALLEQVIYGTLDGEAAEMEAEKLHSALSRISQEIEGKDIELSEIIKELERQAIFSKAITNELNRLTALIDDPDHAALPETVDNAVKMLLLKNDEQADILTGEIGEIKELLNRLTDKVEKSSLHIQGSPAPFKAEDEEKLLREYLKSVEADTRRIDIQGISSQSGAGREAIHFPIEEIYTPLTTHHPGTRTGIPDEPGLGKHGVGERTPLSGLLSEQRRLLIVGDPGGGKTTFLKLIACVLAKDALGETLDGREKHLGLSVDKPALIPIFLRLAAVAEVMDRGSPEVAVGASYRKLIQAMESLYAYQTSQILQSRLERGQCALLLDGLDEVADPNLRRKLIQVVNGVMEHWGDNLIILTSRPFGYQDVADSKQIATAHIDAFGKKEIKEFLFRWGKGLYPDDDERERSEYLPELHSAIIDSAPIRKLARNPVMLTCLCVVHWNERSLPEGKPDLLAAVLKWLLNAREEIRKVRGYTSEFAEECFKALAMAMTIHEDGKQVIVDLAWAAEQLTKPFDDILNVSGEERVQREGRRFFEEEMLYSGIVEKYRTGQLRFWHLNFQEHYAAKALIDRSDDKWWKIVEPHLGEQQWFEVLDHLAGCLAWTGRYRLDLLVENVLGTAKNSDLASLARVVGILGRLLRILKAYKYQPPPRLGWNKARDMVMEIFTIKGASRVPVEQRIAAAEALGQGGDPRIKPLDPEMLPVPGMKNVSLCKYPVTVAEYQKFVDNNGYGDSQYWDNELCSKKEKEGWTEPGSWDEQTEHQNRPVTEVSWYEASAYCKWLTAQTKRPYRLPREEEWEKAAINLNGEYPWGNDAPNLELLNFNYNVGNPTPVGIYPAGAAVGGHLDMEGNVWEWILDWHEDGSSRVLRGGSWSSKPWLVRSAPRRRNAPVNRSNSLGFRLVLPPGQ